MSRLAVGSLVLYKIRPAKVKDLSDKIEIELEGGATKRVRDKDIELLHPGPLASLRELGPKTGNPEECLELLEGETTNIRELSDLLYGEYTPATAWATWQLVLEGVYFRGDPQAIEPRSLDEIRMEQEERARKEAQQQAWEGFLQRMQEGSMLEEDRKTLGEVEALALGTRDNSRILSALGVQETPANAHRLLAKVGYWAPYENPYPRRIGINESIPDYPVPELPDEPRLDLTHLPAFAIDDEDNEDPDDAVSIDGERIWVHVADVAALVPPDSEIDQEARTRGANLYLPEKIVPMLPQAVTDKLGLGLQEISPALSISFQLDDAGAIHDTQIHLTHIRAHRISYKEADGSLLEEPFASLLQKSRSYRERRRRAGATFIQLPEAKIRVHDGEVVIHPLPSLDSREMVTDLMLMAGEAVARYCVERDIPVPFATQPAPEQPGEPQDMAGMYAFRRQLKPSQVRTLAEPHAGLGLDFYSRSTSPLRRYSDLLTHQQLRAHLLGGQPMDMQQLGERLSLAELGSQGIRKAERMSNNHWRLVYLLQNPEWRGEAVVVAFENDKATVVLPEIAMETKVRMRNSPQLNNVIKLKAREIDLPDMNCYFRIL